MLDPFPRTHMTPEEALRLVQMLGAIPTNIGWSISRCMEMPHSAKVHNAYQAIVVLPAFMPCTHETPSKGRGEGLGNTPYEAMLRALQDAHAKAAVNLDGWIKSFLETAT